MNRYLLGTAFGALSIMSVPCFAQAPGADAGVDADSIVVTAQHRKQPAQDIGIALSVVAPEELIKRGVTNINQLDQVVPNLQIEPAFGSGAAQFKIRGVGFSDYATNNSPTVGVYINEVAYPVPVMTQGLIFDIARVEVLRGPQGTLYGRNTTGGAINFITNKPTDAPTAGGTFEYGRYNTFIGEGYVSGKLADFAKIRVSAATEQGGAFQHNRDTGVSLGDADKLAGRVLLELTQGSAFDLMLDAHAGRDHSENVGLYLLTDFATRGGTGPVIPADKDHTLTGWSISPVLAADADLPGDKPGRNNSSWGTSATLGYDMGSVKLTSISSYDLLKRREYGDYDASSSIEADVFFGSHVWVFSQEVRLASTGNGPFQWIAGVYYSKQHLQEQYYSDFLDLLGFQARVNYGQTVESISGFGQAEYAFTPQLKIIGGLRYEDETRKMQNFTAAFAGFTALPGTNAYTKMTPLTGKASIEYKPVNNALLYASFSRGVKSGGFTAYNTGNAAGIAPFLPEKLNAFEVGAKTDLSRAIQFNAAAFYYDYHDQQVLDAVCGANGYVGRFTNAKKSRILGIEADARIRPAAGLTIAPYVSYTSGKYLNYQSVTACGPAPDYTSILSDRSGERIPFPSTTAGANIAYDIPVGGYVVTPSASASYRSKGYSWLDTLKPGVGFAIPSYALVNADLSVGPEKGGWSVALWGRNIFNKQYDLTRNFFTNANVAQPGRPVTYGARLSIKI